MNEWMEYGEDYGEERSIRVNSLDVEHDHEARRGEKESTGELRRMKRSRG